MGSEQHPVQRLALSKAEAARSLGVSVEFFDKHIGPEVPSVLRGRRRLYAVAEIEQWLRRAGTPDAP